MAELNEKTVHCPQCQGDSIYAASNPFRPFCSSRCKSADLGAWASESFRLPDGDASEASTAPAQPLQ